MNKGFYTALGTPLDAEGKLDKTSFEKHIEDQIAAGASGLLAMGSMGMQCAISNSEFPKIAKAAAQINKGRCPLFIGVMDNSVQRVLDRSGSLPKKGIDGIVPTTPFYYREKSDFIHRFFTMIADGSPYPVFLYDLPVVTQNPLSTADVALLMKHGNIKGIKTANMIIARELGNDPEKPADFSIFFSGLDVMDIAYKSGIEKGLDGMFSCLPKLTSKLFKALDAGNYEKAGTCLDQILGLRSIFVKYSVFPSFTAAMNILGYAGRFHPDYHNAVKENDIEEIRAYIQKYELGKDE